METEGGRLGRRIHTEGGLYFWFLNISLVQAWRLYRAHMKHRFRLMEEAKVEAQSKANIADKKAMEKIWNKRRTAERRKGEIPLLEFTRQVVESILQKHSNPNNNIVPHQQAGLTDHTPAVVRFDSGSHLVRIFETGGCASCARPGPSTAAFAATLISTLKSASTSTTPPENLWKNVYLSNCQVGSQCHE